jgi:protoheme IX farnesyltransferase
MLPVVKGARHTKIQMLIYTLILLPVSLLPFLMGFAGMLYAATAAILSLGFIGMAIWVLKDESFRAPTAMFRYSLLYLAALFTALMAGKIAGI